MPFVAKLKVVLKKGKMSPDLRKTIQATVTALKKRDYEMAYELSAVKSLIATKEKGKKLPKRYHFHEETSVNRRVLGDDIYGIMDEVHHELAYKVEKLPSGLAVVSLSGIQEKGKPTRKHPMIKLMERERKAIRRTIGL